MAVVNVEQTASIFMFSFYFFLDHITFLAYRQSALEEEQLYPLCDTDTSTHLKDRSFKVGACAKQSRRTLTCAITVS